MASTDSQVAAALFADIGAPFGFSEVSDAFGGSSGAAADFLGLNRPPRNAPADAKRRRITERKTFQQSRSRWRRRTRTPSGGWWTRLQNAAQRAAVLAAVRARGLVIDSYHGLVDVYGNDIRERDIEEVVYLSPDELVNPGGDFFAGVARGDWHEATNAVATAWFANYVGNDLGGMDATLPYGEIAVRIP